jgi:hypothetical protein
MKDSHFLSLDELGKGNLTAFIIQSSILWKVLEASFALAFIRLMDVLVIWIDSQRRMLHRDQEEDPFFSGHNGSHLEVSVASFRLASALLTVAFGLA